MAFVCSHNQVEVILQSSFNMEYIRKWVAGGYILIFLLIGIIVYVWSYEWHKVEHLELENQKMNAFRQEIHYDYPKIRISISCYRVKGIRHAP